MDLAYTIGGGAPHVKQYRIDGGTTIIAGVPVVGNDAADADGVVAASTTAASAAYGVSLDTATSTDAQATTGDNAGFISLVINPDAVYRAKLTQGATEDTALTLLTATSASADGLLVPTMTDEFTIWGYDGANVGMRRQASTTTAVVQAFPYDIAVGDRFLQCGPCETAAVGSFPQLSTLLTQVDATGAVDTDNDNFQVVELDLKDITDDGQNNSYALMILVSHAFGNLGGIG
jgi:hypothetical protein